MRGMKAFEARPKRQNYRDGGPVRGPGTGTSDEVRDEVPEGTFIMPTDSTRAIGEQALARMGGGAQGMAPVTGQATAEKIPVNLSNGEFKLPPEQVHAVGVQALDQMKDATHAPAAAQARGMKPELFFADGGVVDEEQKRLQNQTAMYVQGAQAAAATRPPEPAPAPPAPAAPEQPSEYGRQMSAVGGALADGAGWLGKTIVSAPGYGFSAPASTLPGAAAATAPAVPPVPATPVTPTTPSAPMAAKIGAPVGNPTSQPLAADAQPGTTSTAQPPPANQVSPSVYRHGRGQYSDQASGMNFAAGFTGQPSAQNLQAAQALSDRSQEESMSRVTARGMGTVGGPSSGPVEPGSFTGGFSGIVGGGSGNMMSRTPEQQRRDAEVQSTSILKSTADRGRAGLAALDALDQQASRNAGALDVANVREQGDSSRAFLRDTGDTNRAIIRESGESARAGGRNLLDARRISLEERGQAPALRAAERQDSLYERYLAAKTPEDRAAIAKQIRDLKGGAVQTDKWAHSPGGQIVDPKTQQLITQPGVIYNERTGETRAAPGAALPPLAQNPAVQQIMNNTALSREERAKQIRALGYQ